jgi:hypothetical protein
MVYKDWREHRCTKPAWKDGLCKAHHPETIEARDQKRKAVWEAKSKLWAAARKREQIKAAKADMFDELLAALREYVNSDFKEGCTVDQWTTRAAAIVAKAEAITA